MNSELRLHSLILLVIFLLSNAEVQWTPKTIPNPWTNPSECGVPFKAWICDPDHLLSSIEYHSLQNALVKLYENERVVTCENGTKLGIQLAVLAANSIDTKAVCDEYLGADWRGQCLEKFTREVGQLWGVGNAGCHNGAVLFICPGLRSAYISTAAGTRKVLSDSVTSSIVKTQMVPYFKNKDYISGIFAGLEGIQRHFHGPSKLEAFMEWIVLLAVILVFVFALYPPLLHVAYYYVVKALYLVLLPFAYIIDLIRLPYVKYKRQQAQQHYEQIIRTLQNTRSQDATELSELATQGRQEESISSQRTVLLGIDVIETCPASFTPTISPVLVFPSYSVFRVSCFAEENQDFLCLICLESSYVGTTTLACSHKFHKTCINQWLESDNSRRCPLCRRGVSDSSSISSGQNTHDTFQARHRLGASTLGTTAFLRDDLIRRTTNSTSCLSTESTNIEPQWNGTFFLFSNALRNYNSSIGTLRFVTQPQCDRPHNVSRTAYEGFGHDRNSQYSSGFSKSTGGGGGGSSW